MKKHEWKVVNSQKQEFYINGDRRATITNDSNNHRTGGWMSYSSFWLTADAVAAIASRLKNLNRKLSNNIASTQGKRK